MAEFKDTEFTPDEKIFLKAIEADNEKEYLQELKKKNPDFLIQGLTPPEKERIAEWIIDQMDDSNTKHKDLCDRIDEYDNVYRMERKEVQGSKGQFTNYRSPLSTVTTDVIHASYMNVLFTPKKLIRVLPTEEGDIDKVDKLDIFANWSFTNELNIFENFDNMSHSSTKNGEKPYIMHWVKEYGTEIKRTLIPNPANPGEPLIDPDTKKPLVQEVEEAKLLYDGPRLEVFSRKDYYQPKNALMGKTPDWEARNIRMTYDAYLRDELQGKMYADSAQEIKAWGGEGNEIKLDDTEGDVIPTGEFEQEFREFYGRIRINTIKENNEDDTVELEELEDEFIAIVHMQSKVLCQLRLNRFPLKERPIGLDYFMPDDEGRREAMGVIRFMEALQKAYDVLFNQFIVGTTNSNNPVLLFEPTGNRKNEPFKIQNGFAYPTANAGASKWLQFPPPDQSLRDMLGIIDKWSQLMFGISDFKAGAESAIDPDAPAKKVEILVQQGNVRQSIIVRRKHKTIQNIARKWFLLYKENMPPNKFMRIAGDKDETFKFTPVSMEDFALKSIPDFELVGNIENSNKALTANKRIAIYQMMVQNPFFNPQTQIGVKALFELTKWLLDSMDELGLSSFLPSIPGDNVSTPEEENARFLQGEQGEPTMEDDDVQHIRVHQQFINDPNIPDELKQVVIEHIKAHVKQMQTKITTQIQASQQGQQPQQGVQNGQQTAGAPGQAQNVAQGQPAGVAGR